VKGYELTDLGKIIIAVFLCIAILTTAVILAVRAWNSPELPPDNPSTIEPGPDDGVIVDRPPPGDSEGDATDEPGSENGEQGAFDPTTPPPEEPTDDPIDDPIDDPVEEPPEVGPVSINRAAGTMSFMFAPGSQTALDSESFALLDDFFSSPKNTSSAQLTVEMPHLSEREVSAVINAVTEAFAAHGVEQKDITFLAYRTDSTQQAHEVKISFTQPSTLK